MSASRLFSRALATSVGSILAAAEAAAQGGGIACLPMTRGPTFSFEKVLDVAEAFPLSLLPNDRGHALIHADPDPATSGTCLLVHRGATTEPVVCTRNIDSQSPFTVISGPDWNERGTIVLNGTLHSSTTGFNTSHIQAIETNGNVFALKTFDNRLPSAKSRPAITGEGDVFYFNQAGSLQRFVPTLPGDDKSETILDVATIAIEAVEPSVEGKLYFKASQKRVGSVQNALGPLLPPANPSAPYFVDFEVDDAFSNSAVPTPSRFGAIVYSTATDIRKRFNIGGTDFVAGDPEFVIERSGAPGSADAPIVTSSASLAGPCKVALFGRARGLCSGGPSDGLVCDPDAFPDPCPDGPGGPNDGSCQDDVQGIFVHQAGTYAAIARVGDPMLGSTVQDFFNSVSPQLFVVGSNAGHIFFPVRLTDGRELIVRSQGAGASSSPLLPTSCAGVSCRYGLRPLGWLGSLPDGVPIYLELEIATGFDYAVDAGDPRFASVMVPEPLPDGDANFTLLVGAQSFELEAGEQFDLTQVDPLGVADFSIVGIDLGEEQDPGVPFVTGATFMEEREANVTVTAVPEPGAAALGAAVLGALSTLYRRRRIARDEPRYRFGKPRALRRA